MHKKYHHIRSEIIVLVTIWSIFVIGSLGCGNLNKEEKQNGSIVIEEKKIEENKQPYNSNNCTAISSETHEKNKKDVKYNSEGVPILMYHSIAYEEGNNLRIPKEKFKEQMKYLKENKYKTLTLDELYEFLKNNKPIPKKSVVITFDDGYKDNYENAYPVLKEFDMKASIFIVTSVVDKNNDCLTWDQIKEMSENGIEFGSHTVKHDRLSDLNYEKQLQTMAQSKVQLEKILGKSVDCIAYPYGDWNKNTLKASKEAGYKMAFSTDGAWADTIDGIYKLDRIYVSASFSMDKFIDRVNNKDYK